jgi:hypothetical protein
LGSRVMGSFDVRFMPCFVDHGPTLLHQKQRRTDNPPTLFGDHGHVLPANHPFL